MIENLFWLAAGLVLGAVYHAKVNPMVLRAWLWIKAKLSRPVD